MKEVRTLSFDITRAVPNHCHGAQSPTEKHEVKDHNFPHPHATEEVSVPRNDKDPIRDQTRHVCGSNQSLRHPKWENALFAGPTKFLPPISWMSAVVTTSAAIEHYWNIKYAKHVTDMHKVRWPPTASTTC